MGVLQVLENEINCYFDDQQSNTYTVLPPPAATTFAVTATSVTTNNGWDDWGTTAEIEDSCAADYWITHVYILSATVTTFAQLQIGIGASGSETWLQSIPVKAGDANRLQIYTLPVPIFAPSASRVAVRGQGSAATVFSVVLGVAAGWNRRG